MVSSRSVDQRVVLSDQRQIDIDALAHARVSEVLTDALAIGWVRQPTPEGREVVLRPRVLNMHQ
jgi:transcriptional regulator of met regulon